METTKTQFDIVSDFAQQEYGVDIKFKDESRFMKLLGALLFFNKQFMTHFVTTIGSTVYFPTRAKVAQNPVAASHVLCHELVHVSDEKRFGSVAFKLSYLFPQCLAAMAVSTVFVGWPGLLFLLFLLPIPAPGRLFWELRGYAMTDATRYQHSGKFVNIDLLASQFTSSSYYFMWPFSRYVKTRIKENRAAIVSGEMNKQVSSFDRILQAAKSNANVSGR